MSIWCHHEWIQCFSRCEEMPGLGSWNQFLKISDYLKTCSPVSLEYSVPHSPRWTAFRACWGSTAAAQDSGSAEAGGKCSWQTPICLTQPAPVFLPGEEPGGLQSMGWQRVRHHCATKSMCVHTHTHPTVKNPHITFVSTPPTKLYSYFTVCQKHYFFSPSLAFVCLFVWGCVRSSLCHECLSSCCVGLVTMACGIWVPWPGTEPMSPALEGGFFITGPQQKSPEGLLLNSWFTYFVCYMYYIFYNKVN